MLRAVPFTVATAAEMLRAFKSGIFSLAISSTCFCVTLPTLFRLGSPEPLAIAGGPFQKHGGRWCLGYECDAPIAVHRDDDGNNQPFLIPGRGPGVERLAELHNVHAVLAQRRSAGGAGVAFPAGSWSFTIA